MLENPKKVGANREYHTYIGTWKGNVSIIGYPFKHVNMNNRKILGASIAVASHGVGAGGASCCFEELIQAGVTTIIRAGLYNHHAHG